MIDDEMALRYSKIVKQYCEEHTCATCIFYMHKPQECALLHRSNEPAYQYNDEERMVVQSIVMLDKYCNSQGGDDCCGNCIFNKLTPGQATCPIVDPKNYI